MEFVPTSTNLTEVLVMCLAVVSAVLLMRKQYDSNMPLLFYFVMILFINFADRPVDPYLLYGGLLLALTLRFEFMGTGFAKFIGTSTTVVLCLTVWYMLKDVVA